MRGLPFRVYLSGLLLYILKLRYATPTVTDLTFFHWCTEKHGEFIAHPLECSKFIRCSHDRAYVFQCPAKLRWNQTIKTCDWEARTKCFLDGVIEVNTTSGDVKKKSVKRDTSLHAELYASSPEPSPFSSTSGFLTVVSNASESTNQVSGKSNVTEYPINLQTIGINLLTTLKSILKTPCTKKFHISDGKRTLTTVNNITEYLKITEPTRHNDIEYQTSTEADNLRETIFKTTRNSNDALTELSTADPMGNRIPSGLPLTASNDSTAKELENFKITESSFNYSLPDEIRPTEPLTVLNTQQYYENIITSELPDISIDLHSDISKQVSSVPISVLTSTSESTIKSTDPTLSTGSATEYTQPTTTTESTTVLVHDETSVTENQNDNEWKLTALPKETSKDQFSTTRSEGLRDVTDINVENDITAFVFTSAVTEPQTEHDRRRTESSTKNGNGKGINVNLAEGGNTEFKFTTAEIAVKSTESATENDNIILAHSVDLTEITESAIENDNTMLGHTVDINAPNLTGVNLELTENVNTELIFKTAVTETQNESSVETTRSATESDNTMLGYSVEISEQTLTVINLELTEGGFTELPVITPVTEIKNEISVESTESAIENGDTTVINMELTEGGHTELTFTTTVTEAQYKVSGATTEPAIENSDTTGINLELREGGNTELTFTTAVTETQNKVSWESATENGINMLSHSVEISKQTIMGINMELTDDGNTELTFTTDFQTEVSGETGESAIENGDTTVIHFELTEDGNTKLKVTDIKNEVSGETAESAIEHGNTMVTQSDEITEQTIKGINRELTEGGNTELTLTTAVTEIQTEVSEETPQSAIEDGDTTGISLKLTEGGNIDFTTENDKTKLADSVDITEHVYNLTELPQTITKINTNVEDYTEIAREVTSEVVGTLTTEGLTDSKSIILLTEDLTDLYTTAPNDLIEATTNLGTESEITSSSSAILAETSTITVTDNTMYTVKLTDEILNESAITTLTAQRIKNLAFLTEISSAVTELLTDTSTNLITTVNEYFTQPTTTTIILADEDVITTVADTLHDEYTTMKSVNLTEAVLEENVKTNLSDDEREIINNISTDDIGELRETPTNVKTTTYHFEPQPTTYTVMVTETSTDAGMLTTLTDNDVTDAFETQDGFTETAINSTNLTEAANVNVEDFENTIPEKSLIENDMVSTATYSEIDHEKTEEDVFYDSSLTILVMDKIKIAMPTTEDSVTDAAVTYDTDSMSDVNSDANIMVTTTTVKPSTVITDSNIMLTTTSVKSSSVITDSVTSTEIVDVTRNQKYHDDLSSDLFQDRQLEVTSTVNVTLLPLKQNQVSSNEDANINVIATNALTTTTAFDYFTDDGPLSIESMAGSTTIDPRLPFRSSECKGDNNNRQFKASKCSQYYQCFAGWAFLLNCYEGYLFVVQEAKCIQDINRDCNE